MEKVQDDDAKMVAVTHDTLIANILSWTPSLIIQDIADDMESAIVYITAQQVIQMTGTSDQTNIKVIDHDLLAKSVIKVKSGIVAYSNSTQDFSVFHSINISNSDIKEMKDNELRAFAIIVHTTAVALGIKLLPFNVVTADFTLLKTRMDNYDIALPGSRTKEATVVVATANIVREIARIKGRLINELDPLVDTYEEDHPDFVNQYKSARKLIHYGVRHNAPEAFINSTVTDSVTQEVLRLVKITVVETGDVSITNDSGTSYTEIAKAGVYTITYEKPGYQKLTKTLVELGVGDRLALSAAMIHL